MVIIANYYLPGASSCVTGKCNAIDSPGLTHKDRGKRGVSFLRGRTSDTANGITLLGTTATWKKKLKREIQSPTKRRSTRTNLMYHIKKL